MQLSTKKADRWSGWSIRLKSDEYVEWMFITFGLTGFALRVSFPSTWHEEHRAWFAFKLLFIYVGISIPWKWLAPDYHQCSGPTYGFDLSRHYLRLDWGQDTGRSNEPLRHVMLETPYKWRFEQSLGSTLPETHAIRHALKDGTVQETTATIELRSTRWVRFWGLCVKELTFMDVSFDREMGEKAGTWKGGTFRASFPLQPGETPLQGLQRQLPFL